MLKNALSSDRNVRPSMQQINSVFKDTLARITGNSYKYNKILRFNFILIKFN